MNYTNTLCALALPFVLLACSGNDTDQDDVSASPQPQPMPDECVPLEGLTSTCGYLAVKWDIEDEALSCDDVSAGNVRVEITPAGESPREVSFDCDAGSGLTLALQEGPYSLRMHLIGREGGALLASSPAETVILPGRDQVFRFSASFRLQDTAGRARYQEACSELGAALCQRLDACGTPCSGYDVFKEDCCENGDDCDDISPLSTTEVDSCTGTLESISCAYIDSTLYHDLVDLSFCSKPPPAPITAASLGKTCSANLTCPAGYTCLTGDYSELGFCSIPCTSPDDEVTCSDSFSGPGVAACGFALSGTYFCGVFCGEHNSGDQSCPGMLECEDGYDNNIEPDTCVPQ